MSDLGRLFRRSATDLVEPLENFTTEALAIAIGHDHRPMREALRAVDWSHEPAPWFPAGLPIDRIDADAINGIGAQTQRTLWSADNKVVGYLDLVLYLDIGEPATRWIWVEVKVNAFEHGRQLETYAQQARLHRHPPRIITLGRTRVSPHIPFLLWSSVASAIEGVPDVHHSWVSLLEFLREEGIASRPAPSLAPMGREECIDVVVDVNRRLRNVWPTIAWVHDGQLRNSLRKQPTDRVMATGGPLRFGLRPTEVGWVWAWVVTTANSQTVPLNRAEMLRDAETGHLPSSWVPSRTRWKVLERRVPADAMDTHDGAVAWFDEGLQQLRDAKIMDRFLTLQRDPFPQTRPAT